MRVHYYKLYNNLIVILSENVESFHIVIMNFVINMLSAKNLYTEKISDAILMLINKLIKYATYIAITKNLNAESLINIL